MDNMEKPQQRSRVEEARDVISGSPERIEREFARSENNWLSCFGTSIFAIETYLDSPKVEEELGTEKYNQVTERLEVLKERLYDLQDQYPDKSTPVPGEIKQELLSMLDVLK